jgi:uncharacterized protein (DUF302 family)
MTDIVDIRSRSSVDATVDRLKNLLDSKGVTLFAIADQAEKRKGGNVHQ